MTDSTLVFDSVQFFYNPPNIPYPDDKKLLSWLDPVGTLLYAAALTPLLMGLIWGWSFNSRVRHSESLQLTSHYSLFRFPGGATYTWNSAAVISSLVVGAAMGVMFIIHQAFFKADGIFHRDIFKNRNAGGESSSSFFGPIVANILLVHSLPLGSCHRVSLSRSSITRNSAHRSCTTGASSIYRSMTFTAKKLPYCSVLIRWLAPCAMNLLLLPPCSANWPPCIWLTKLDV